MKNSPIKTMIDSDVIILGAGASGLMCAIEAAKRGRRVNVIERSNKPGKKILMSGGGRCNFTNVNTTPSAFISNNPKFCYSALNRYQPQDFIDLVERHQIPYHEKKLGQLFCDHKSKDIVQMLLSECQRYGVTLHLNTEVSVVKKTQDHRWHLATNQASFCCQSLVIATGGLSIPTLGSSPFGYKLAQQYGIKVWPTRAGLVPFTLHDKDKIKLAEFSGVALDCRVQCNKSRFEEAMLFTHRGLSGPAMLQISNYWQPGDSLLIDLYPHGDLLEELLSEASKQKSLLNCLGKYYPRRLIEGWFPQDDCATKVSHLSQKQLAAIADSLQHWQIQPNQTEGYRTAEVTLGGVDCHAICSKSFACKQEKDLYFIGEVLDMTGWLGGYNFQWAWASGFAAGQAV
jgi:predicted Rossmann fold flavoprotein